MIKEQPQSEVSGTVSAESLCNVAAEITSGSLEKFKDVKSLEEAYINLQSEFTRKCQKLSELEKENLKLNEQQSVNNFEPLYQKPEWTSYVEQFLQNNKSAQKYAAEIMDVLIKDKALASLPNSLEMAYNQVKASKYRSEEELVSDSEFINNFILNNENIKNLIINNYLNEIKQNKSPQLINSSFTGSLGLTPITKPNNLSEAKELAKKLFNK